MRYPDLLDVYRDIKHFIYFSTQSLDGLEKNFFCTVTLNTSSISQPDIVVLATTAPKSMYRDIKHFIYFSNIFDGLLTDEEVIGTVTLNTSSISQILDMIDNLGIPLHSE